MLKRIFAELKPGGRLVLNDPRDFIQNDLSKLKKFLNSVAKSAARNDSPMTEFDVAFIGAVNLQFLVGGKTKFLSTTELQALASQAGFQVEQTYDTYYGAATMLILRKP
jgi:ubiquinone/menaquinone biosynthesis C-methylase UbiE